MTVLLLQGMRDASCREVVATALESVSGVVEVDVNLFRGMATIVHDSGCELTNLLTAVSGAGYVAARAPREWVRGGQFSRRNSG